MKKSVINRVMNFQNDCFKLILHDCFSEFAGIIAILITTNDTKKFQKKSAQGAGIKTDMPATCADEEQYESGNDSKLFKRNVLFN